MKQLLAILLAPILIPTFLILGAQVYPKKPEWVSSIKEAAKNRTEINKALEEVYKLDPEEPVVTKMFQGMALIGYMANNCEIAIRKVGEEVFLVPTGGKRESLWARLQLFTPRMSPALSYE